MSPRPLSNPPYRCIAEQNLHLFLRELFSLYSAKCKTKRKKKNAAPLINCDMNSGKIQTAVSATREASVSGGSEPAKIHCTACQDARWPPALRLNELCALHPPCASQKGRTRESFFFFFFPPVYKAESRVPSCQSLRPGMGWWSIPSFCSPKSPLPKISSPQLCLHSAKGKPMSGDPVRRFSVVGTPRLCFYVSPTAQAGYRLLSGFNVNLGQEPSTTLYPQFSDLLVYIMQWSPRAPGSMCLMRF